MNETVMFVSLVYVSPILREVNKFSYLLAIIACIFSVNYPYMSFALLFTYSFDI